MRTIVWAKLAAMAEGARLDSGEFWKRSASGLVSAPDGRPRRSRALTFIERRAE